MMINDDETELKQTKKNCKPTLNDYIVSCMPLFFLASAVIISTTSLAAKNQNQEDKDLTLALVSGCLASASTLATQKKD